jgi:hypothetical protein
MHIKMGAKIGLFAITFVCIGVAAGTVAENSLAGMTELGEQPLLFERQLAGEATITTAPETEESLEKNDVMTSTQNQAEFKIDYKEAFKKLDAGQVKKVGLARFNKFHKRMEYVIGRMPNAEEVQKRFQITFENICDSKRMGNIQLSMSTYITDVFEKSQLKMQSTNAVLKDTLLKHFIQINSYTTTLNKYTEKIVTSFVTLYFGVRMQTILAYIASILNQKYIVKLAKTGTPEVDSFQRALTFYMFKKETLESDLTSMNELVLAYRSDALKSKYYEVNFSSGNIKASPGDITTRKQKDEEVIKGTCSAILSTFAVYLNNDQAVKKSMTDIFKALPSSYGFFKQFLNLYAVYVVGGYDDVGELLDKGGKPGTEPTKVIQDCKEFKGTKVYKDIFSFVSFNKIGVDFREDKTKFTAREFFYRAFFTNVKKGVPSEAEQLVEYDMFVLHAKSDENIELEELFVRFGLLNLPFHYLFMNDFSVVLFYDFPEVKTLSFKQYYMFRTSTPKPTELQVKGMSQAEDLLTILTMIYKTYVYMRFNIKDELSKYDKVAMNQVTAVQVYTKMLAILTDEAHVAKLVENAYLPLTDFASYYLHLLNYVCTKLGKTCTIPEGPVLKIIAKYKIVLRTIYKITIIETILTIYKKYKEGDKIQQLKDKLTKIKFIKFQEQCRDLNAKIPACKPVIDVYVIFIKFIMEVFSLKEPGVVDQLMEFTFSYEQQDLGEETQEIIYLYFFSFFNVCIKKGGQCPMKAAEFDGLGFWVTFLKRVKRYYSEAIFSDDLKGYLEDFLHGYITNPKRYSPSTGHFIIKLTESQFQFIEELYYFFIYKEYEKNPKWPQTKAAMTLPKFQARMVERLQRLSVIFGVVPTNIYKTFAEFEKKMKMEEAKVMRSEVAVKNPRDWKVRTQNGVFEAILTYSRLTIFLKGALFFKTFNPKDRSLFAIHDEYQFQNPLTVLFNYFSMLHDLADKNKFYLLHVNGHLYRQIKECLVHTSKFDFVTSDACQFSHRKYAEMYFFVQFNYRMSSQNQNIPLAKNYDESIVPTHIRIFIASVMGHSSYLGLISQECSLPPNTIFCIVLNLSILVKNHVVSTDKEQLTTQQFENKVFGLIPDNLNDADITKYRFSLLGASEVVSYLSLRSQTTDRFTSFADWSTESTATSKDPAIQDNLKRLKTLQTKGIFRIAKENKGDIDLLTSYLFRSFYKPTKTQGETKGSFGVSLVLKVGVSKLKEFLQIGSVVYVNSLKIFLVYAPRSMYLQLASLIVDQDIFLQIPFLNVHTFDFELNSLTQFLDCDQLQPGSVNFKGKKVSLECKAAPGKPDIKQSKFYLDKIYNFIRKNNESIRKNDVKQVIDDNKEDPIAKPNYDSEKNTVTSKINSWMKGTTKLLIEEKRKRIDEIKKMPTLTEKEVNVEIVSVEVKRKPVIIIRDPEPTAFNSVKIQETQEIAKSETTSMFKTITSREGTAMPDFAKTLTDSNVPKPQTPNPSSSLHLPPIILVPTLKFRRRGLCTCSS